MTYTVYYKKTNSIFWKKLKKVKGDGLIDETSGYQTTEGWVNKTSNRSRWFVLEDETRIEIPVDDVIFKFSPQRFMNIKKQMDREIGR